MNLFAWYWSFCVVIGVLYTALIVWFLNGWKSIAEFKSLKQQFTTKVTVIVPFYNEQKVLQACVDSLLKQHIQTSNFEVLLVDDQSRDQSTEIAKTYAEKYHRISYLQTTEKGKKQAILLGVDQAVGDLIVTTDADCLYNNTWLSTIVDYYEQYNPNMIVGPVVMSSKGNVLQKFQQIEFSSLVASAAGAVGIGHAIMANGANLAFKRDVFKQFDDPLNIKESSGDDVFLLHNMKTIDNDKIHFLKSESAMVETKSLNTFQAFFKQRIRWSSKSKSYKDNDTKFTAFVVFAANALWLIGSLLIFYNNELWKPALFLFILKTIVDLVFLNQVSEFFATRKLLKWIPLFQFFYGFYVLIAGLSAIFTAKKR